MQIIQWKTSIKKLCFAQFI